MMAASEASDLRAGRLLVATPLIADAPFHRAVVLLLQGSTDDGALGIVLNRPLDTELGQVLPGWDAVATAPQLVFQGGPVQPQAAVCLARLRAGAETGVRTGVEPAPTASVGLAPLPSDLPGPRLATVDLDADPDDIAPAVDRLRVFAGYAGWSAGQLEAEVEEGAWWVLDPLPDDAFPPEPAMLRRQVLRRQGPPLAFAATLPDDPTLN